MAATAVDASAIAAVLFMEPEGEAMAHRLAGTLIAPPLISFELANVCVQKMRRHAEFADQWLERYRSLPRIGIKTAAVDFDALPKLARRYELSAYDAAYLQIALRYESPLITLDARLAKAYARAAGE